MELDLNPSPNINGQFYVRVRVINFDKRQKEAVGEIRDVTQKEIENKCGCPRAMDLIPFLPQSRCSNSISIHSPDGDNVHTMGLRRHVRTEGPDVLPHFHFRNF